MGVLREMGYDIQLNINEQAQASNPGLVFSHLLQTSLFSIVQNKSPYGRPKQANLTGPTNCGLTATRLPNHIPLSHAIILRLDSINPHQLQWPWLNENIFDDFYILTFLSYYIQY